MPFVPASKSQSKARIALVGPSGSGKTYTACQIATGLGGSIAVIDTENGSAAKYCPPFTFDVMEMNDFDPDLYVKAIHEAEAAGYDVLIIDSLSHAWMGKGGALEQVDHAAKRVKGNSFAAWRDVTPKHNALVDALVRCKCHLIVTMRSKTAYEVTKNDQGKVEPIKLGLAPVQREGLEYEFDILADMNLDHQFIVSKTRMPALDGKSFDKPGPELGAKILGWLTDGAVVEEVVMDRPALAPAVLINMIEKRVAQQPEALRDQPANSPALAALGNALSQVFDGYDDAEQKGEQVILALTGRTIPSAAQVSVLSRWLVGSGEKVAPVVAHEAQALVEYIESE